MQECNPTLAVVNTVEQQVMMACCFFYTGLPKADKLRGEWP